MKNKAQSTLEYMVLIAIVVVAFIAMQIYLKRGMQGRLKTQANELSGGSFYSPGATSATSVVTATITESGRTYSEPGDRNISETDTTINQTTHKTESVSSYEDGTEG